MHLDGLLSSFMVLALVALLVALDSRKQGRWQWGALLTAGIAAGLAWLTRSPGLFLLPFAGLVGLPLWGKCFFGRAEQGCTPAEAARFLLNRLLLWGLIGGVTFFVLWPAMWVDPWGTLRAVLSAANEYAAEGHADPIFFNGTVYNGDPGFWFYPITWLWRVTPVVLIGVLLGVWALVSLHAARLPSRRASEGGALNPLPDVGEGRGGVRLNPLPTRLPSRRASEGGALNPLPASPASRGGANAPLSAPKGHPGEGRRGVRLVNSLPDVGEGWGGVRLGIATLLLLAILFMLFMNLGAKKFDRYLLPVYPALDLVAGLGWVGGAAWVRQRWSQQQVRFLAKAAIAVVLVAQVGLVLPHYPYYLTYYNPLLGGGKRASTIMQIGRGEGANLAAHSLNQLSANPQSLTVASSFPNGPFSYFFQGRTVPHTFWPLADYAVVYTQDFQRQMPSPRQIVWFEGLSPIEQITLHGIEYARIYDLHTAPMPPFVTTWSQGDIAQIRLNAYELTAGSVQPGEALRTTFYLENLAPLADDLNVLVRLVGADGGEIARSEGWPWGAPTSTWQPGEIWPDGHTLQIPAMAAPGHYRLELGFYTPVSQATLAATQMATAKSLSDLVPLDFIQVGEQRAVPALPLAVPYQVGELATLIGYTADTSTGRQIDIGRTPLLPGENLDLTLFWQVQQSTQTDYTAFVHVVDSTGAMLTQQDQQPTTGFLPTSLWPKGQVIADRYTLTIPDGAALGTYQIHVGLYDLATLARLPVQQAGSAMGDNVPLTRLVVALSRMEELKGRE